MTNLNPMVSEMLVENSIYDWKESSDCEFVPLRLALLEKKTYILRERMQQLGKFCSTLHTSK